MLTIIGVTFFSFLLALVFITVAGDVNLLTVIFGVIVSSIFTSKYYRVLVKDDRKLFQPSRYLWMLLFIVSYLLFYEIKAHIDLVKRILSPVLSLNPGIVKIRIDTTSEYSMLMIANAITNTPGTVTIYADSEERELYIHWIDVKTLDPVLIKQSIAAPFESYAKKIFD